MRKNFDASESKVLKEYDYLIQGRLYVDKLSIYGANREDGEFSELYHIMDVQDDFLSLNGGTLPSDETFHFGEGLNEETYNFVKHELGLCAMRIIDENDIQKIGVLFMEKGSSSPEGFVFPIDKTMTQEGKKISPDFFN